MIVHALTHPSVRRVTTVAWKSLQYLQSQYFATLCGCLHLLAHVLESSVARRFAQNGNHVATAWQTMRIHEWAL